MPGNPRAQEVQDMVNGKTRLDLVVTTVFGGECGLALAYILKVPLIFLAPTHLMGQFANNLRLPHPTTYVPFLYSSYSPSMTFWERLSNLASYTMMTLHRELLYAPNRNVELRKIFGEELPCMLELERDASLIFLYTHVSMGHPQPHMPNTIEVGGMHLRPGNSLPQDLQDWMDGSGSAGVIYFSLGTNQIASNIVNEDMRHMLLKVFSKLPQRVIWKWESGEMEGLPDNVRVFKFLPQQDILAHNSTKAFITHGGLLSTQEAMYHAVPVIVLPGGLDQPFNAKNIVSKKGGIMLSWETITAQSLTDAINTVIHDPSYKESLEKISTVYKGQPMSVIDTAMYWVDFVIKHKGAGHLRSHALQLTWYQYYGLDIVIFIVTCFIVTLWLFSFILHRLCQAIMKKTSRMNALKKKKA